MPTITQSFEANLQQELLLMALRRWALTSRTVCIPSWTSFRPEYETWYADFIEENTFYASVLQIYRHECSCANFIHALLKSVMELRRPIAACLTGTSDDEFKSYRLRKTAIVSEHYVLSHTLVAAYLEDRHAVLFPKCPFAQDVIIDCRNYPWILLLLIFV